jgi:hypothetical protein
MWFYPLIAFLVVLGVVGGIFGGGIYTLVLVPIAVIAALTAVVLALWGRALEGSGNPEGEARRRNRPLPHREPSSPSHVPTSPDRLIDERRAQQ